VDGGRGGHGQRAKLETLVRVGDEHVAEAPASNHGPHPARNDGEDVAADGLQRSAVQVVEVAVRDEHHVDRLPVVTLRRIRRATDERHPVGEDRVGENAAPCQLDEHGGMTEVAQ